MKEFSSVEKMLNSQVLPIISQDRESFLTEDKLRMTTTWIVIEESIEFSFSYEKLNIDFANMHVIVNPAFFKSWKCIENYPDAYHRISKNVTWDSINSIAQRGERIEAYPILFISLNSCFKNNKIDLGDVLSFIDFSQSEKQLIISISSEEIEMKKIEEIEKAKQILLDNNGDIVFEDFKIKNKDIEYYGFTGCFSR